MADSLNSRRETLELLEFLAEVSVPLPDCAAARLLGSAIGREWNEHLWTQRSRAFLLLRDYIHTGERSLPQTLSRKFAVKLARLDRLIPGARQTFLASEASFFWRCALLDRKARRKHWPALRKSDATVQRDSARQNVSFFRPAYQELDIHRGLLLAMAAVPDEFLARAVRFVAVDFGTSIGFARGMDTSVVLFDVDYAAMHAHAYPIATGEIGDKLLISARSLGITPDQLLAARDGPELKVRAFPLRRVYLPRLPTMGRDRFELLNAVEWSRLHPETYLIPVATERGNLLRGDLVRLTFRIRVSKARKAQARIWVIISRKIGDYYVGVVDNDSEFSESHNLVRCGDEVAFRSENICNISPDHFRAVPEQKLAAYFESGDLGRLH